MSTPYEQTCPACGAPPERVTKKHWDEGAPTNRSLFFTEPIDYGDDKDGARYGYLFQVTKDHIEFRCEVCGKRWAKEVVPCAGYEEFEVTNKNILSPSDIKSLQDALGSDNPNAAVLVDEAVEKMCEMVTDNALLRKTLDLLREELYRAGNELTRLREEVAELQGYYCDEAALSCKLEAENKKLRAEVAKVKKRGEALEEWRKIDEDK